MCARQFLPERRFWKYGLVNQLFQIIRVDVAQLILLCGHSIFRVTSAVESDMFSLRQVTVLMLRVTCSPTGPLALVVRRRISSCTTTVTLPAVAEHFEIVIHQPLEVLALGPQRSCQPLSCLRVVGWWIGVVAVILLIPIPRHV